LLHGPAVTSIIVLVLLRLTLTPGRIDDHTLRLAWHSYDTGSNDHESLYCPMPSSPCAHFTRFRLWLFPSSVAAPVRGSEASNALATCISVVPNPLAARGGPTSKVCRLRRVSRWLSDVAFTQPDAAVAPSTRRPAPPVPDYKASYTWQRDLLAQAASSTPYLGRGTRSGSAASIRRRYHA
jgi:hypothetical protein